MMARWPGHVQPGSTSDEIIAHVDLMATVAAILGVKLPDSAGEDSYNVLPALLGERRDRPIRPATVHHSGSGHFAIRQGNWVFIDHPTGDDNREPEWFKLQRGYVPHGEPGELFDLRADLPERRNLYGDHPDVVRELKGLLESYKRSGRSTPGAAQKNDVPIGSGLIKPGSKGKPKRGSAPRPQSAEGSEPIAEENPDA
jgi:arylsulfatase A-like enzyme